MTGSPFFSNKQIDGTTTTTESATKHGYFQHLPVVGHHYRKGALEKKRTTVAYVQPLAMNVKPTRTAAAGYVESNRYARAFANEWDKNALWIMTVVPDFVTWKAVGGVITTKLKMIASCF